MSSPMIPSPVMYSDIPGGGQLSIIVVANSAPTTAQNQQQPGTFWLVPEPAGSGNLYFLAGFSSGVPQWELISTGTGSIVSVAGTANQITASTTLGAVTLSIPAVFIAPGSIASATTLTAGTGLTVTTGGILVSGGDIINSHSSAATDVTIEVTNSDNTSGTSRSGVEIAVGGASSGDPYLSFQISGVGASTMTMGLDNSASDLFVISNSGAIGTSNALTLSQAGALTATTSITATLGDITATNGNLVLGTAGNKLNITTGANASVGVSAALDGASPSQLVVATTAVTASSLIFLSYATAGGTQGSLSVGTIVANTSFQIKSSANGDTSTVNWIIIN